MIGITELLEPDEGMHTEWEGGLSVCRWDEDAPTLSGKHLRAQQIKIFIGGNKLEHPIGDEEYKFMRNVNAGIISSPDG